MLSSRLGREPGGRHRPHVEPDRRGAQQRGGGTHLRPVRGRSLPFADASFDAAVACLVFEHIDAMSTRRSPRWRGCSEPGGRFLFFLNHPLLQTPGSGWIDDQILDPPEQYWRIGPYLIEAETIEEVEKGVFIPFIHRPLSRYVNALAEHGPRAGPEWTNPHRRLASSLGRRVPGRRHDSATAVSPAPSRRPPRVSPWPRS
jgi:hypothetical protein